MGDTGADGMSVSLEQLLPIMGVYAIVQSADMIKVIVGYILVKKGVWITNLVETE